MRLSLKVARLVNLVLAVMLTGHEFSGFLAIYPTLGRISPLARLEAEQGIYRRLGGIMPYYMGSTISSFLPALALGRRPGSSAFRFTVACLACFVAMGAITRTGNLPINARIEELLAEEASFRRVPGAQGALGPPARRPERPQRRRSGLRRPRRPVRIPRDRDPVSPDR